MSKNSEANAALRSLLPEEHLIRQRDPHALKYKYLARLSGWTDRVESLTNADHWLSDRPDFTTTYSKSKIFDGLIVDGRMSSPVAAINPDFDDRIRKGKKDATLLHVSSLSGAHHFRTQLAAAAEYIAANDKLAETKYVAGFTYPELGRLAIAVGFRNMTVEGVKPAYELDARASHMAYCAINNKQDRAFEISAVYLPTEVFIDQFSQSDTEPLLSAD